MLALLLALTAAQPIVRAPPQKSAIEQYVAPRFRWSRSDGRYTPGDAPLSDSAAAASAGDAFFEAFPLSGAGTTTACSTTAPTGARGEVLTFTRTGNATCSKKGLATTGIADGDLVVLSGNVARVEPDADGVLGLRVEGARTNSVLHSGGYAASAVAWNFPTNGPVVGLSDNWIGPHTPDGGMRLTIAPSASGQYAVLQGATMCPASIPQTASVYVKSVDGGTGTLDFWTYTGGATVCSECAYGPTWSRCVNTNNTGPGTYFTLGNDSFNCSTGTGRPAADVYIALPQCEAGAYATSPIITTTAAATRNAETAYFAIAPGAHSNYSMAATFGTPRLNNQTYSILNPWESATAVRWLYNDTSGVKLTCLDQNTTAISALRAGVGQVSGKRASCHNDGTLSGYYDGTVFTTPAVGTRSVAPTRAYLGTIQAFTGYEIDGIVSKVCFEPNDPTRCR